MCECTHVCMYVCMLQYTPILTTKTLDSTGGPSNSVFGYTSNPGPFSYCSIFSPKFHLKFWKCKRNQSASLWLVVRQTDHLANEAVNSTNITIIILLLVL